MYYIQTIINKNERDMKELCISARCQQRKNFKKSHWQPVEMLNLYRVHKYRNKQISTLIESEYIFPASVTFVWGVARLRESEVPWYRPELNLKCRLHKYAAWLLFLRRTKVYKPCIATELCKSRIFWNFRICISWTNLPQTGSRRGGRHGPYLQRSQNASPRASPFVSIFVAATVQT